MSNYKRIFLLESLINVFLFQIHIYLNHPVLIKIIQAQLIIILKVIATILITVT